MITFADTPPADVRDAWILASIERAEDRAELHRFAALSAALECTEAAIAGDAARVTEAVTDMAVLTAETVAFEGAIVYTRARLAVSRFVAGVRGAR